MDLRFHRRGRTPLHGAAERGHLDVVKFHTSLGANPTIRDNDGKTAFDLGKKHIEIATHLGHAMGVRFQTEDRYEDAKQIYTELLGVQEEVLGCDHADTLKTRELISGVENMLNLHLMKLDGHAMGARFEKEDRYEDAKQIYTELLEVQVEVLGCDHEDTLKTQKLISGVENMLDLHVMRIDFSFLISKT